jgi:hypothetical protein
MDVLRAAPTRAGGDSAGALMVAMCVDMCSVSYVLIIPLLCLYVVVSPRRVVADLVNRESFLTGRWQAPPRKS